MSSEILSGDDGLPARPIEWRSVGKDRLALALTGRGAHVQDLEARLARHVEAARGEGRREGEAAGEARARQQLEPLYERLSRTIAELADYRPRLRRNAEQDVVKLAVAVARKILRRELTVDPEALLGIVKAALDRVDVRECHLIRLHPADAGPVARYLENLGVPLKIDLRPDPALERGSAIFETARGELDASLGVQLAEIEAGFTDLLERRR